MPYYVLNFKHGRISQNYHRRYRNHNHSEGTKFSRDAKADFIRTHNAPRDRVEQSNYRSNQSHPLAGSKSI